MPWPSSRSSTKTPYDSFPSHPSSTLNRPFRFEKPLGEVIVSVLPILGVMLVFVLAITYLPLVLPFPGL